MTHGKFLKLNTSTHILYTHTQHGMSIHVALSKYFKEIVVNHGWSVTGEWQSGGRSQVTVVGLVQQAMDVRG